MLKVQAGKMRTGQSGHIAIFWSQTEIDGLEAAPLSFLKVGAAWSWRGQARFLGNAAIEVQERAGGTAVGATTFGQLGNLQNLPDEASGLVVLTNGAQQFTASLYSAAGESAPVLVFEGECPSRDQEFWISEIKETVHQSGAEARMDETVVAFPSRSTLQMNEVASDHRSVSVAGHRAD